MMRPTPPIGGASGPALGRVARMEAAIGDPVATGTAGIAAVRSFADARGRSLPGFGRNGPHRRSAAGPACADGAPDARVASQMGSG